MELLVYENRWSCSLSRRVVRNASDRDDTTGRPGIATLVSRRSGEERLPGSGRRNLNFHACSTRISGVKYSMRGAQTTSGRPRERVATGSPAMASRQQFGLVTRKQPQD